nr:reverse transcriptase domain-containing protein [Tanacetum cinerariifolium]
MSSHNAQSAVTYTSISSNSDGPSWGIPLMNADELPEMDPYKEVAQQGQAHPLSPAYVPDLMELDEHVSVYVPEPGHPEYHAPSDDDIQVEDDDDDPEEDPSEEHEPEDEDTKEPSKGFDETEPFEEDKIAVTPPPPRHCGARISVRPQTPMAASTQALIDAFDSGSSPFPLPPTSPAYDQAQLESFAAAATRAPRSQYNFVDTVEAGQGLIRNPGHDTRTIARAVDRAEDVGYVKALQASEQLQEVHQAYLSFEDWNRELLARLETLETHMSRMEWKCQSAEDLAVTQMMCIHTLEARARADTVEDADKSIQAMIDWAIQRNSTHTQDDASQSSGKGLRRPVQPARVCSYTDFMKCQPLNFKGTEGVVGLSQWLEKMESVFHISGCAIDNQVKFATCTMIGAALTWWNGHVRTLGHDAAYAMTWGTLKKKLMDKYCPKGKIKKLEIEL